VPFDPAQQWHARVKREGMARGLMTYPVCSTIDGRPGDPFPLAPPFVVADEHPAESVRRLRAAVDAAGARV
jgi:adenosylmethionine-8-amino-7-oxononanoate aminotransferase